MLKESNFTIPDVFCWAHSVGHTPPPQGEGRRGRSAGCLQAAAGFVLSQGGTHNRVMRI
jgi:hypothetical protein